METKVTLSVNIPEGYTSTGRYAKPRQGELYVVDDNHVQTWRSMSPSSYSRILVTKDVPEYLVFRKVSKKHRVAEVGEYWLAPTTGDLVLVRGCATVLEYEVYMLVPEARGVTVTEDPYAI